MTTHPPNSRSLVFRKENTQYLFPRISLPRDIVRGTRRLDSLHNSLDNCSVSNLYSLSRSAREDFHCSTRSFSTIPSRSLCNSAFFPSHSPCQHYYLEWCLRVFRVFMVLAVSDLRSLSFSMLASSSSRQTVVAAAQSI